MCGRFTLTSNLDDLQGRFQFEAVDVDYKPSYNIAPTQEVLAVTNDGHRQARLMRWGLVPFWAKDLKVGSRMINAVGETVAAKPAFRSLVKKRRCLILADGFFEWRKKGEEKIPTYIFLKSKEAFALAGLWDTWKSPEGQTIQSCTIITTTPNGFIAPIHNRMPVVLSAEAEALWLDPLTEDAAVVTPLLIPCPAEAMDSYIVSQLVNSARNNVPDCISPVG